MEKVLRGYIGKKCLLYLDDVIVFGRTFEEVYENVRAVMLRLRKYNLKLKASKCHLFQKRVNFLGHVVSEEGVSCDPEKIERKTHHVKHVGHRPEWARRLYRTC